MMDTATEIVGKAYAHGAAPRTLIAALKTHPAITPDDIAAALLPCLLPRPAPLPLGYLAAVIAAALLPPAAFVPPLLVFLLKHDTAARSLAAVTDILALSPLPLTLSPPLPPLPLLMPLLRASIAAPASSIPPLTATLLAALPHSPPPSLDVALEAGHLLPLLPDPISGPLRLCLRGLIADLASSPPPLAAAEHRTPTVYGHLPLAPTLAFLLEHAHHASRWTPSALPADTDREPPPCHRRLLHVARHITASPQQFLQALYQVSIERLLAHQRDIGSPDAVADWAWLLEGLPSLLYWWKHNTLFHWQPPSSLRPSLEHIFQHMLPAIESFSHHVLRQYDLTIQHAEAQDDSGGFTTPHGWKIPLVHEYILAKLVQLDLLSTQDALALSPNASLPLIPNAESLLERLASESRVHLKPLVFLINHAYGASSSFTTEFITLIRAIPQKPPPDCLLPHISSQPSLFPSLTARISPPTLFNLLTDRLITAYAELDDFARSEDPQRSLTRFGEGVVLVERFAREFNLDLPDLLLKARRATNLASFNTDDKDCLNAWVKAIFGSDGIEDQILLATPLQTLYTLMPSLIQQAMAAVACGQIDLDILHSGLSYFSQPLLSWCLGGVIAWLTSEIIRQGSLSALHLIVLQALVLGDACPEQLLRVNDRQIHQILEPNNGLKDVMTTCHFDGPGLSLKMDQLGYGPFSPSPPETLMDSLQTLHIYPLAPSDWPKSFLCSITAALHEFHGASFVMKSIITEAITPSVPLNLNANPTADDHYKPFVPLLVSIDLWEHGPLVRCLPACLRALLDHPRGPVLDGAAVADMVRACVLLADDVWGTKYSVQILTEIIDNLQYSLLLPVESSRDTLEPVVDRRKKKREAGPFLRVDQKEMVKSTLKGLRDDEAFRNQYGDIIARLDSLV